MEFQLFRQIQARCRSRRVCAPVDEREPGDAARGGRETCGGRGRRRCRRRIGYLRRAPFSGIGTLFRVGFTGALPAGVCRHDLYPAGYCRVGYRAGFHQLRQLLLRTGAGAHPYRQYVQGLRRSRVVAALQFRFRGVRARPDRFAGGLVRFLCLAGHRIRQLHFRIAGAVAEFGSRGAGSRCSFCHGARRQPLSGVVYHVVRPGAGRQGILRRNPQRPPAAYAAAGRAVLHLHRADHRDQFHSPATRLHDAL